METKFGEIDIGEVFILYPNSNLLYEKINETDAKNLLKDFYIKVDKEHLVTIIAHT